MTPGKLARRAGLKRWGLSLRASVALCGLDGDPEACSFFLGCHTRQGLLGAG